MRRVGGLCAEARRSWWAVPFVLVFLSAPAGSGKLEALRAAAKRASIQIRQLYLQGRLTEALTIAHAVVQAYREEPGCDPHAYAASRYLLEALYRARGEWYRVEPLLREAPAVSEKALGRGHPEYATSLSKLGALYIERGEWSKAEPLLREALAVTEKAQGRGHPEYANRLNDLAALFRARGEWSKAEPLLREALELCTGWRAVPWGAPGIKESQRDLLDSYLSLGPGVRVPAGELYRRAMDWKGAAGPGQAEDRVDRGRPELKGLYQNLDFVASRMYLLAFHPTLAFGSWDRRREMDDLVARKEQVEVDLARRSAAFRRRRAARRFGPDEVAAALPPGAALVDLLEYGHSELPAGGRGPLRFERRLLAFVLRPGRPVACVPLGSVKKINDAVQVWRLGLGNGKRHDDLAALRGAAGEIGKRVWDPLQPHLVGATSVLVAPDGELIRFPFAALPGSRPGSFLIEDVAIGYVGSGRRLAELLAAPAPAATGAGLLAVGGVDFQADPGGTAPSGFPAPLAPVVAARDRAGFDPLPGTGVEVAHVEGQFRRAFPGQEASVLTGPAAGEAAVKQALTGRHWRVLHLATHGFLEPPDHIVILRCIATLATRDALPKDGHDVFALALMYPSGLVLAGANRGPGDAFAGAGREDGVLTAEEVAALDLWGTELVVLSACETGLGWPEVGEGVVGLQRAFHAAGARAVAASLWKVNDAATSVLMERFYDNLWRQNLPKLEALRQAQLAVLRNPGEVERRTAELKALARTRGLTPESEPLPTAGPAERLSPPGWWAAFVLSGDVR
jgi:CHAT domain-containing protein/tetratricopeptide (TPR) repeat protein